MFFMQFKYCASFIILICSLSCTIALDSPIGKHLLKVKITDANCMEYYKQYETEYTKVYHDYIAAYYDASVDLGNQEKQDASANALLAFNQMKKKYWDEFISGINMKDIKKGRNKRLANFIIEDARPGLSDDKILELSHIMSDLSRDFENFTTCEPLEENCDLSTRSINDYEVTKHKWMQRGKNANGLKNLFKRYVKLSNEHAKAKGYNDYGEMWRNSYEIENFPIYVDTLWTNIEPLCDKILSYTRHLYIQLFNEKLDATDTLLPLHISTGFIHPDDIYNIQTFLNYNLKYQEIELIFHIIDFVFISLQLPSTAMSFNKESGSVLTQKDYNNIVLCTPSGFDFGDQKTFKIRMCAYLLQEYLITIAQMLGQIQYFLNYKELPFHLRNAPHNGILNSIGRAIGLSVTSMKYLQRMGIISKLVDITVEEFRNDILLFYAQRDINLITEKMAIDKWRWDVFSGAITEDEWNERYWKYVNQFQQARPPEELNKNDFDPGRVRDVISDTQGIDLVISFVLQHQLHKSFCLLAGEYDPEDKEEYPLFDCDFSNVTEIGDKLEEAMELGRKKTWREVLKIIVNVTELDVSGAYDYFEPLLTHLEHSGNLYIGRMSFFWNTVIVLLPFFFI